MTKPQLSLIRKASTDHADGDMAWKQRLEQWMNWLSGLPIREEYWVFMEDGRAVNPATGEIKTLKESDQMKADARLNMHIPIGDYSMRPFPDK